MSRSAENLLLELGCEELPPKSLVRLAQALADGVSQGLKAAALEFESVRWLAAPRRLALQVQALSAEQPDQSLEKRGPALQAAFDAEGKPTPAALGFARSCQVEFEALQRLETDKGAWLVYRSQQPGKSLQELLPAILQQAIAALPIAKPMRWGNQATEFIRPVHWLTLLYGKEVLPVSLLGLTAGRISYGHRVHTPQAIELAHADQYQQALLAAKVRVDFEQRCQFIRAEIERLATEHQAIARIDEPLLAEVANLVEWPVALVGQFEAAFLAVPKEALMLTMQDNQKYFPLLTASGELLPRFVFIANIDSSAPEKVIDGNERVIRPRFSDAQFFFNDDRKNRLDSRLDALKQVVYQQKLGSLYDKSGRLSALSAEIARLLGADPDLARRAGWLAKCDLLTRMVYEFPEVQGIMGRYYAQHDGEPEAVAQALAEQYLPAFAGDVLPASDIGTALALAERLDQLVGIFALGQKPTGDKDPFGLRRAAIGLLRILIEQQRDLSLTVLLDLALARLPAGLLSADSAQLRQELLDFLLGRLKAWYQEQGVDTSVILAVLASQPECPLDVARRIEAVQQFRHLPQAQSLAAANKRVSNLLEKAADVGLQVQAELLVEPAEQQLWQQLQALEASLVPLFEQRQYQAALQQLAALQTPVDAFFEQVMVLCPDLALRQSRLAMLARLRALFWRIADISLL